MAPRPSVLQCSHCGDRRLQDRSVRGLLGKTCQNRHCAACGGPCKGTYVQETPLESSEEPGLA